MEVIDDWANKKRVAPQATQKGKASPVPTPREIEVALAGFEPRILTVHCYEDVGYPWVHVVFEDPIDPSDALRVGEALASVADAGHVYLNSLRPEAVYFLLEPAFEPEPDLRARRYGMPLAEISARWARVLVARPAGGRRARS